MSSRSRHSEYANQKHGESRRRDRSPSPDNRKRMRNEDRPKNREKEQHHSNQRFRPPDRSNDERRPPAPPRRREPEYSWGKTDMKSEKSDDKDKVQKEKPNFEVTGKLAADTNTFNGVVVKYNEPPEARKPKVRWRLYPFKGDESLKTMFIHRQSAYLIGRDHRVADLPVDHPSCSKQHAALQYRLVPETRPDGQNIRKIKPYVIDLGSANGTYLNNNRIEAQRYYELFEKDVLKFGFSSREYVLMNEKSIDNDRDDKDGDAEAQQSESEKSDTKE